MADSLAAAEHETVQGGGAELGDRVGTATAPVNLRAVQAAEYERANARLLERFRRVLDADEATVLHAALLCLSGALHPFRSSGVRFAYISPQSVQPNGPRGAHVDDLVDSFRKLKSDGTPPPPILVVRGIAMDGNHRLHAAQRLNLGAIAAFIGDFSPDGAVKESPTRAMLRKLNPRRLTELDRLEQKRHDDRVAKQRSGKR